MAYLKYDGTPAIDTVAPVTNFYGTSGLLQSFTGTGAAEGFWGAGPDTMTGGAGDDTYYLQASGNKIVELAGGGVDKIVAWQSVNLANYQNIENVEVDGDKTYGAGDSHDNIVRGGAGSQQLYGGGGQDVLIGGAGADTFIIVKGTGNDVIQDFSVSDGDMVRLTAGYTSFSQVQAHLSQVGADVKLDLGGTDGLIFRNLTVGQLTAANFQLQLDTSKLGAMTFHDDFTGPLSLWDATNNPAGTWRPDFGYQGVNGVGSYTEVGNSEAEIYTSPYFRGAPGNSPLNPFTSNADGTLTITAAPSSDPNIFGYHYTSGMISTAPSFAQTYGYFEMKAELPSTAGAWPAFWLIPADGSWPPELDVMETLTSDPHADYTTWHSGSGGVNTSNGIASFIPDTTSGFHTYGVLWTKTDLVWYVDGVEVFHQATPADMNKPMFMIANLALGGWGGTIDNSAMPAQMKIDYIHAYALADGSSTTVDSPTAGLSATAPIGSTGGGSTGGSAAGQVLNSTTNFPGSVLVGGAGADTFNAGQGSDTMTGGAGGDTFAWAKNPWSPGTITDFQVGVDKLDVSKVYANGYHGTDPLADHYALFVSDGHGGAAVLIDPDGPSGSAAFNYVADLLGVSPTGLTSAQVFGAASSASAATATPPTTAAGQVINSTTNFPGSVMTGGAGADTLNAGQGSDTMTGGAGADHFSFAKLPWAPAEITDFQHGQDVIDLRGVFAGTGYTGADPVADHQLTLLSDGAGGTKVLMGSSYFLHVDHVAPTAFTGADWLTH
jgi:beta-glucanase (GH16 family)/Ca2+-binding RTX toxin-like protein